ncbi:MAG: NAD(P)H-dependent oxidoreductase [Acidimicrobiales bacterium]
MIRVIQAHPVPESFSGVLLDAVVAGVRDGGVEPVVTRLGDGREPGPTAADLIGTTALHLVYPTWWGGQPAVLLDWIQRTLAPWIDDDVASTRSPLADVTHLAAVTTHGSSKLVNRLQGEPGRHLVTRVLARLCHPDVTTDWVAFYGIERSSDAELRAFLDRVRREVRLTIVGGSR